MMEHVGDAQQLGDLPYRRLTSASAMPRPRSGLAMFSKAGQWG